MDQQPYFEDGSSSAALKKRKLSAKHGHLNQNGFIVFELIDSGSREGKFETSRYLVPVTALTDEDIRFLALIDGRSNHGMQKLLLAKSTLSEDIVLNRMMGDWNAAGFGFGKWSAGEVPVVGFYTYRRK